MMRRPFPPSLKCFVLERSGGTVVRKTRTREPAPLRRIAGFNPDPPGRSAGKGARPAKNPSDSGLAQRSTHVLWCHKCTRVPGHKPQSRDPQSRGGRVNARGKLVPAVEVTPYNTEVIFCGGCPRKLCKDCYVNGDGHNDDQSTWVSLRCLGRGLRGPCLLPKSAAPCCIRTFV